VSLENIERDHIYFAFRHGKVLSIQNHRGKSGLKTKGDLIRNKPASFIMYLDKQPFICFQED
jgi:hypothetical protein